MTATMATTAAAPMERVRTQVRTKSGKKRRRPRLAPRYLRDSDSAEQPRAADALERDESIALLRDVFTTSTCRCFILKSFSEANLHKSLKYGVWSSTYAHNMALDQVFRSELSAVRPVLFFFSVCDTRHFNGIARMTSSVRTDARFELWEKSKYDGFFYVEWLLVKDVPNYALTGIKMSNTPTKKSITSCRDCEEVLYDEASEFISIFSEFPARTSAWDDFAHFDRQQAALESKRGLPSKRSARGDGSADDLDAYLTPVEPT